MNIIDIHARIERDIVTRNYLVEDLLEDMNSNLISERWVSCFDGESMQQQNDVVIELAKKHRELRPCIMLNPRLDSSKFEIERTSNLIEIKMVEFDSVDNWYHPELLDFNIIPILEQCKEKSIVVKIYSGSTNRGAPDSWRKYIERFPQINFIIEHMGAGDYQYGTIDLAKEFENIYLETSLAWEKPALNRAFKELGVEKMLFGSHYPTYITELEIMKFNDYNLSEVDLDKILRLNAKQLLI